MHKSIEKWIDIAVLVVLLAISAVTTFSAVPLIVGDVAAIGNDKMATNSLRPKYESIGYHVEDLLLAAVRVDPSYPIDEITVKCGGQTKTFRLQDEKYISNTYALAYEIMQMKPAGITEQDFYLKPLTFKMNIDSTTGFYAYTITVGG